MAKTESDGGDKKKRIYEVAREFNLSSKAMVEVLRSIDFDVKNHMAVCTQEMFDSVQRKFEEERAASRKEIKRKDTQQKERQERERAAEVETETKTVKKAKRAKKAVAQKPSSPDGTRSAGDARTRRRRAEENVPVIEEKAVATPAPASGETPRKSTKPVPKPQPMGGPRKRRRRRGRPAVDQREVEESVRRTMAQMETGDARTRRRRRREEAGDGEEVGDIPVLKVAEFTTVGELADLMELRPAELITKFLQLGMMVTINQRLDMDTIGLVADEFDYDVEELSGYGKEVLEQEGEADAEEDLEPRPPVVTIMGHVDHGKTSLLDLIRRTNVVAGEAGGITQHIGAYHVQLPDSRFVTFLDTPGHEAFTAMRARGAQVTDVVVLIVAADDNVMPQTIEAIDHAKAAEVPIVVAINKVDLPTADPVKIRRQLAENGVMVEGFGGQVQVCEVSAETGQGVDDLLALLALETELLELRANPNKHAKGTVVEAQLDRGRGNVATVLVQEGSLKVSDPFVAGAFSGRVRAMLDERGNPVEVAGPSVPVQVLGLQGLPQAGDTFYVVDSERMSRDISQKRQALRREQEFHKIRRVSLAGLHDQIQAGKIQELRLIIKADVDGSVEALHDALLQITSDEVRQNVIHRGVGAISESDVLLASASDAIIIGFNVRADANAREVAAREHVDIRHYRVIYEAVEDVKAALSGLLSPDISENIVGQAEVRETFTVPRIGTIAGCHVTAGNVTRSSLARVVRDGVVAYESQVGSLRRFKDDVREVQAGFECGIGIENFSDIKIGDVIELFEMVETERTL